MIAPEAVEKLLENPFVRLVAGFSFLLLVSRLILSLFLNLFGVARTFDSFFFDRIWRLSYLEILAAVLAIAGWAALSLTRRFEQPFWFLVAGAFAVWVFIVSPLAETLSSRLSSALGLLVVAAQASVALLALVALDRAIPKMAIGAGAVPLQPQPVQQQGVPQPSPQQPAVQPPAVQQQGPQPAGWYEDPRGEATWRWWDGQDWTENTG